MNGSGNNLLSLTLVASLTLMILVWLGELDISFIAALSPLLALLGLATVVTVTSFALALIALALSKKE